MKALAAAALLALSGCAGGLGGGDTSASATVTPGCPARAPTAKLDPQRAAAFETRIITRTCIYGVDGEERAAIEKAVHSRPGAGLLGATIREDLRVLMAAGHLEDAKVSAVEDRDGITVVFALRPRPRVAEIVFEGAPRLEKEGFPKRVSVEKDRYLSMSDVFQAKRLILEDYRRRGYRNATVEASTDLLSTNRARIKFVVVEGPLSKIGAIVFEGASRLTTEAIRKASQIDSGQPLDQEKLNRAVVAIQELYLDNGMLQIQVEPSVGEPASDGSTTVTWRIREGEVFRVGSVRLANPDGSQVNVSVPPLKTKKGATFSRTAIDADMAAVIDAFAKRRQKAVVVPQRVVDVQKRTVDISFEVSVPDAKTGSSAPGRR